MSKVFNMVSGGGRNISSIIITGLESTDTVTCTKDGKSYTATWDENDQHWEIIGLPLGMFTITASNGVTKSVLIDIVGVYEIFMSDIFTRQEILDMGCFISESTGDTLYDYGGARYVKRNENKIMVACSCYAGNNYRGYALISDEPITEVLTYSSYGDMNNGTGTNAYIKIHKYMASQQPYFNDPKNVMPDIFTAKDNSVEFIVDSESVELVNKIARSIPYL